MRLTHRKYTMEQFVRDRIAYLKQEYQRFRSNYMFDSEQETLAVIHELEWMLMKFEQDQDIEIGGEADANSKA